MQLTDACFKQDHIAYQNIKVSANMLYFFSYDIILLCLRYKQREEIEYVGISANNRWKFFKLQPETTITLHPDQFTEDYSGNNLVYRERVIFATSAYVQSTQQKQSIPPNASPSGATTDMDDMNLGTFI